MQGLHIQYDTARVRRKLRRIDLRSGAGVNQHTLRALGILGFQYPNLHPGFTAAGQLDRRDGVPFIVLDGKDTGGTLKQA